MDRYFALRSAELLLMGLSTAYRASYIMVSIFTNFSLLLSLLLLLSLIHSISHNRFSRIFPLLTPPPHFPPPKPPFPFLPIIPHVFLFVLAFLLFTNVVVQVAFTAQFLG